MNDESTDTVQWLGLRLRVPTDWEIVRHSLALDNGSLVFVDRRRERLRLYWRDCPRAPDLGRMLDDQRGKQSLEFPGAEFRDLNGHGGWRGFVRGHGSECVVHAARFDARTERLLEVIVTESGEDASVKSRRARLLGHIDVVSKAAEATEVRAFGLNVTVPGGMRLVRTSVKPADVILEFAQFADGAARARGASVIVHRMGMAAAWAPDDTRKLLGREAPGLKLFDVRKTSRPGHTAWLADGAEIRPRLKQWLGLGRRGQTLLWHCEAKNDVYAVATTYPKRHPLGVEAVSAACCAAGDA